MLMDDEAKNYILDRLNKVIEEVAELKAKQSADHRDVIARQQRSADIAAEQHQDIRILTESLKATSAAVAVLWHDKYEKKDLT